MDIGFSCKNCFAKYTPEEFVAARFSYLYRFVKTDAKTIARNAMQTEIGGFYITRDEVHVYAIHQVTFRPVVEFLAKLGSRVVFSVAGTDAFPSECHICGQGLSFISHLYNSSTIGCHNKTHAFFYEDPLDWVMSILKYNYPDVTFDIDIEAEAIKISYEELLPEEKLTRSEKFFKKDNTRKYKVVELSQTIKVASDGKNLAIWVPKNLPEKIGDIFEWLNSLNVKNVKAVLVNS
jgi:hypothetical protein